MNNPLSKLLDWYRSPIQGETAGAATSVLGVLPSRVEQTDIVGHLIEAGHTPATAADVRDAFEAVHGHEATTFEALVAFDYVDGFGLLA